MRTILCIDTSHRDETVVELKGKGQIVKLVEKLDYGSSQTLLPQIARMLKKKKLLPGDISEIRVNTGPGSYTGLRVGVAVANTLGWFLKISVNGKRNIAQPVYQ